jgi:PAS domain S-box-containing protein
MSIETRPSILIVEDDPGIATLQRRRLERAGFNVQAAGTVDEALATLAASPIALVVLDYRLGETTGLDLHRRMKASGVDVPVILVSAAIEDTTIVEALRAGVRDIVVKTPDYLDYLPAAVRGVLNQTSAVEHALADQRGSRVLIVEDDPATAALEKRKLERAGYQVSQVATAEDALAVVRSGDIALAVLDLRLPGNSSGLELYEQWRSEGFSVPAILVTGFPDQAVAIRALRAGVRDFVPKSTDFLEYLPTAVDRVISQIRIERKLAESELRLASIIGTTLDAILMCDAQGRIVLFNRSAEEMFGCSAADALSRPLPAFIPGLTLGSTGASQGHLRERRELDAVTADGRSLPIEVSIADVVISGERLFTVIARDISERRRAEAELREADRRKDEFLGMLAHELRNPLAAVMTAGEVLHRSLGEGPGHRLIDVIRRQTRTLSRMVDDLLDVSRVTLGKIQLSKEPLLFDEVVARSAEAVRTTAAGAGLRIDVRIDRDALWMQGDTTRLEQVVTNLLTNAVKFTPSGGTITVSLQRDGADAVLRIRDTGVGMGPELLPRVFDLFVQGDTSLDRSRSGLGIGLALVRQIVVRHGGTVTASSEGPHRGSEFVVRLPLTKQDVRPMAEAPASEPVGERRINVLVVDDQRDIADSVAMLIETFGHHARAVYDGAEALAISREQAPDAMFVDIGMPGMTGYELAEAIRRDPALAKLQLVALTGYGREEDRAKVAEAGFDLHMTKPVTDADLHAVLASVATTVR